MESFGALRLEGSLLDSFVGRVNSKGRHDLNVVLVANPGRTAVEWSAEERSWPLRTIPGITPHARIMEFTYDMSLNQSFSWSRFIELGGILVDCLVQKDQEVKLRGQPLIFICHGLGGTIVKRTISILNERFYDPSLSGFLKAVSGLVFLGTPHPTFIKEPAQNRLDNILSSISRLSKKTLENIAKEAATVCNVSLKFEEVYFRHSIITAYEGQPTKFRIGSLASSRKETLVNRALAATSMSFERLIEVDADHMKICNVVSGTQIFDEVVSLIRLAIERAQKSILEKREGLDPKWNADDLWGSTPAASQVNALEIDQNRSVQASPMGATAGSSEIDFELLPAKSRTMSTAQSLKIPCYILGQQSAPGSCHGRESILKTLDETLLPDSPSPITLPQTGLKTFALCGMGGIGKTQVAREFAWSRKLHFDAVFWVNADNESKLAEGFNLIALELGLTDSVDAGSMAISRDRVLGWLIQPSKYRGVAESENLHPAAHVHCKYLLIFDNADRPELLAEYWPAAGSGSVLITSRDPLAKSYIYSTSGTDLEPLTTDAAAQYLRLITGYETKEDVDHSIHLAERLGGLPLALVQVAGILRRRDLSFKEFVTHYEDPSFLTDIHKTTIRGFQGDYTSTLFDVWAFEHLQPTTVCLLNLIAFMDPDSIYESIFVGFDASDKVIQDSARARMQDGCVKACLEMMLDVLAAAWPSDNLAFGHETGLWKACSKVLPHIERLMDISPKVRFIEDKPEKKAKFGRLLVKAGWFHFQKGNYEQSMPFFETAERLCQKKDIETSKVLADSHFGISAASTWLKDYERAQFHCGENLKFRLTMPNDHTPLAIAYSEFAAYYLAVGKYEEAAQSAMKAIETYDNVEEIQNNTYYAMFPAIYAGFANIYLGRLETADRLLVPCLAWQEKRWGLMNTVSFRTGLTMYALGNLRAAQHQWVESHELHKNAYLQYCSTIGNNHPHTASALVKLSDHYVMRNELAAAE
ncbi:uncharacterized protein N7446_001365 [Penicillium canescens]|uniref:NB-ARC domain-containing protein n=1 Tax=Penicillium canescens TaxID=5083 RepID=A0AAD6IDW0_PENCN|nr:uncharacterized protein N7446_001365 [Penicillium canescens]KAJ6043169.1 hypothetical protein N7460_004524 [Penicillium canescens]KAJ6054644.1 hypothetical protein N7444_003742 [Penicillium canescens]KAJ6073588.1 hypothetical protein N7446_001365 [Penicillium canescens]